MIPNCPAYEQEEIDEETWDLYKTTSWGESIRYLSEFETVVVAWQEEGDYYFRKGFYGSNCQADALNFIRNELEKP